MKKELLSGSGPKKSGKVETKSPASIQASALRVDIGQVLDYFFFNRLGHRAKALCSSGEDMMHRVLLFVLVDWTNIYPGTDSSGGQEKEPLPWIDGDLLRFRNLIE
ncbi:hypothetical protein CEXT_225631 [Caerostris extrusa]|uniref:Uncharacterized protein n=1 Tax=Caerostris extrusa TaxID=172846 RepID=A0AAV4PN32_CAEEX|nr:hypothetical protein CEXT_225631 [Caerostris extrusa]